MPNHLERIQAQTVGLSSYATALRFVRVQTWWKQNPWLPLMARWTSEKWAKAHQHERSHINTCALCEWASSAPQQWWVSRWSTVQPAVGWTPPAGSIRHPRPDWIAPESNVCRCWQTALTTRNLFLLFVHLFAVECSGTRRIATLPRKVSSRGHGTGLNPEIQKSMRAKLNTSWQWFYSEPLQCKNVDTFKVLRFTVQRRICHLPVAASATCVTVCGTSAVHESRWHFNGSI